MTMEAWEASHKRADGSQFWLVGDDGLVRNTSHPEGHAHGWVEDKGGFTDQVVCECGWKSHPYWDGAEWAMDEWDKHLVKMKESEMTVKLEARCPKHPTYRGLREPRVSCRECEAVRAIRVAAGAPWELAVDGIIFAGDKVLVASDGRL